MGKLKNRGKALVVSGGLIFGGQGLEASAGTVGQSNFDELNKKEQTELVVNLTDSAEAGDKKVSERIEKVRVQTERDRMDKINAIPFDSINQQLKTLVVKMVPDMYNGKLNKYYGHDKYIKEAKKIQKEYRKKVKELKLNETVFKCGEQEFDRKMGEVEQEIMANPDKYGHFSIEGKFVINVEAYKNLIHEKFPESGIDDLFDSYLKYDDSGQYTLWDAAREGSHDEGDWPCEFAGWFLTVIMLPGITTLIVGPLLVDKYGG